MKLEQIIEMAKKGNKPRLKATGEDTRLKLPNAELARVRKDPQFRKRIEKPKKGKGSYSRKNQSVD